MKYSRVYMDAIAYELPPVVVSSAELEERLAPLYEKLNIAEGQLEALTGISERRWWEPGYSLSDGAITAAKKALAVSNVSPEDIEMLAYGGVCRENFEPATACRVAAALGISPNSAVYDISNACLGVMNGIVDVANRIQLGQIRAGMIVSSESARMINEIAIDRMLKKGTMEYFIKALATLTGGSGSIALIITDDSFTDKTKRKLLGGVNCSAPEYHHLCRWGMDPKEGAIGDYEEIMSTDSVGVLKHGVELGARTWRNFLNELGWSRENVDATICHQVGESHRDTILKMLGVPSEKDFVTYEYLGNIGTVSLPITAAIAQEREFLTPGQKVAFLGIGSGLNCLMLGWEW